jgi:hypothetical protein
MPASFYYVRVMSRGLVGIIVANDTSERDEEMAERRAIQTRLNECWSAYRENPHLALIHGLNAG